MLQETQERLTSTTVLPLVEHHFKIVSDVSRVTGAPENAAERWIECMESDLDTIREYRLDDPLVRQRLKKVTEIVVRMHRSHSVVPIIDDYGNFDFICVNCSREACPIHQSIESLRRTIPQEKWAEYGIKALEPIEVKTGMLPFRWDNSFIRGFEVLR